MFLNKKVWIVGGTHGIGKALDAELTRLGAKVISSGRSAAKYQLDVNNVAQIKEAQQQIIKDFGEIDILVYASGVYKPMSCVDFKLEEAIEISRTNFEGALNVLSIMTPYFVKKESGHIAIISSIAGYFGLPNSIAYSASKAALISVCETLKIELRHHHIKVQMINPGFVKTRLTDKNDFPMPFIIESREAAQIIARGLDSNKFEIHFPKRLTYIFKFLYLLPRRIRIFLLSLI